MDWDALRTFEAVARLGSFTRAAEALGLSQSTVSRHISRLESQAGSPILLRSTPIELTERGVALRDAVTPMTRAALNAQAALESAGELRGEVRVTAIREMVRWVLLPRLPELANRHPGIRLSLLAGNEVMSLAAGEADIALRWPRPERGDLVIKRLHTEEYALFAHRDLDLNDQTPWLSLAGSLRRIPEAELAARMFASRPARFAFEDFDSLGCAVATKLGAAVLPKSYAKRFDTLTEVPAGAVGAKDLEMPTRPMWMVVHRSRADIPIVRATIDWLGEVFEH